MIKKILHTSDWHIGRRLKNRDRLEEHRKFFDWLEDLIQNEHIDVLLVAGDIFDNSTPSVQAQDLYYSFLSKIAKSNCRHTVIISGNHDSPSFIDASSELLKLYNIHVVGSARENVSDEIITLYDENKIPEMIVCAVPYLRDRDVQILKYGQKIENFEKDLVSGIENHYKEVCEQAKKLRADENIPLIAMGHLFVKGGKTVPDDGARPLYVGTSIEINGSIFPKYLNYTALGHLHTAQKSIREDIRYSGSPLAIGFGEAKKDKSVNIIEFDGKNLINISEIKVPVFQQLEKIEGDIETIFAELNNLVSIQESIWLDITYKGSEMVGNLQERLNDFAKNFPHIDILSIRDESRIFDSSINAPDTILQNLESIKPLEMLELFFNENKVLEDQREILIPLYNEIMEKFSVENIQHENT